MTNEELLQVIEQSAAEGATELDLAGNELTALPAEIGKLTNLKKLILGKYEYNENGYIVDAISNKLSFLPKEVGLLSQLEELDLGDNQLISLPVEIVQLTNLQSLDLGGNRLNSLPAEIVQLTNLQSLYLDRNQLRSLPAEIGQLTNLQSLDLDINQLNSLPAEIVQLTNLQSLHLSYNRLNSLPAEIVQLTNLQSLYLDSNQLRSLPAEIGQLGNLQFLYLSGNQLRSLPVEIVQLGNLQSLFLKSNQLSSLPAEIGQLGNLQFLYLYNNQLRSLPPGIVQLGNLQSLDLRSNRLSSLPPGIVQLVNLQSLYLSNNQLRSLPVEIVQLVNLQSLDLRSNQLSSLPADIRKLTKLQKLDLRGNPVPIPPEILGAKELWENPGDVKEILDFYFRTQDPNETEPFYEAKLLIIGEGESGKTSLAKKIKDENYQLQSDEESTKGINVIQWKFLLDNGKEFRVNIWDFGGQEIYHQTHQFFLTKRSLYALVADSRRENTNFYWWLKVAELLSDNSPVLIIKNEKQDRQCQVNERQLRAEFTNLEKVLATNLETNRGLASIKQTIQDYITRLPHVGTPLPKLWVRVRLAIENDSRNYISLEEYRQLCIVNNLTDREDMDRLSRYLHDLGVCLHFQDDPTLKHYVILKPEWGTTAVYKVLDNQTVKENLGCFSQENLADIWQASQYAEMRDELLQLMMRFKLCYPIPNRPHNYIAPQLLDIEQPEYNWDKERNLILRYQYEFMPKGMLTRFIVETHPWIEQQIEQKALVWRSGVVLHKDQTRAEIIENYDRREITVRVAGSRIKELLAVVTYELDKIHRSYERLQYQTLVPCNCTECSGSENPHTYPLENLRRRLEKGRYQIECEKSFEMVDVRRLIDDVNLPPQQPERKFIALDSPLQQQLEGERQESFQNQPTTTNQQDINIQTSMNYQDFQILVDRNNHIRVSSDQGEVASELRLEKNEIELALELIESGKTNSKLLKRLGNQLYQALFSNQINARFHATMAGAQAVRLRLIFESPELAALPWEFLYDEGTNTFLGNNTQTVLSRYIDVPLAKRDIKTASLPLKVLLVIASPSNLPKLDTTSEEQLIRQALEKHIAAGQIELDVLHEATIRNINQKLREKPYNVFHFIGHGVFENNKGYICLVDTDGKAKNMDDESFANFFLGNNNLGLVILNSCQGAAVSSNQAFAGTAPNLVRRGIPAVVAMQYSIWDNTAKLFADEFYRTLALNYPVDAAIQTTRNAISMEVGLDKRDFATPVLYMRAKDGMILQQFSIG